MMRLQMDVGTALLYICLTINSVVADAQQEDPVCRPTELDLYDYIVVGGGTAGSAAAATLARQLPTATVLLLDQGKDFSDQSIVMDNDEFVNAQQSPYCEHYFSTETALAGNSGVSADRNIYTCVSKILGGASSLNYGGWYRAPESDLTEWATLSGNADWNYDNLLPYFHQLERVQRDEGAVENPDRGYDGLIPVRHQNISILHYHIGLLSAIEEHLGVSVGDDQDSNNRHQDAIGSLQVSRVANGCWYDDKGQELGCAENMRNGSAYNVFIRDPQRAGQLDNLHVLQGAKVVLVDGVTPDNLSEKMTVEYVYKSYRYRVEARQEILLSAGSWANPKIALLSGIGNATELADVNIQPKIDLPGVGRHLKDHGVLWLTAMLNNVQLMTNETVDSGELGFDPNTFAGVNNPLPALLAGFNTINLFFKSNNDTLDYPDMEFLTGLSPTGPNRALMLLRLYQNRGTSGQAGGYLKLRSDDPNEEMDTSRNWYADDDSIEPMLASLKKVINMVQTSLATLEPMILEPNAFTVDYEDDEALKAYIRSNVVSEMHLQGSMKMGIPDNDPLAVVDGELKLIGSNGRIRVADTSSFPAEFRGHPMAMAMVVGMRAADLIAAEYQTISNSSTDNGGTDVDDVEVEEIDQGSATVTTSATRIGRDCAFAVSATAAATTCAFAAF